MFLKSLQLTNYRNFTHLDVNLSPLTLMIGQNAQGKTNLLEAICFLATTKSTRAEKDAQLIKQGESFLKVEGELQESVVNHLEDSLLSENTLGDTSLPEISETATKLEITLQFRSSEEEAERLEKRTLVNGVSRRVLDYIGNLVVVSFSPEDINLVTGSPALRRWYLDLNLAQIDREYKHALTNYVNALASRNRILKRIKEGLAKANELDFWTEEMIKSGEIVSRKRSAFFGEINSFLSVGGETLGKFRFDYEESLLNDSRSREYLNREIEAGSSLIGPHRDDFKFILNGKNLAVYGSRGEQRTAVLELKLSQLKFVQKTKKLQAILLLDDVFSELDEIHRNYVYQISRQQQTIISAVEGENIPPDLFNQAKVYKVECGEVSLSSR